MFSFHRRYYKIVFIFIALITIVCVEAVQAQKQDLRLSGRQARSIQTETATGDSWNVDLLGRWAAGPCVAVAASGDTALSSASGPWTTQPGMSILESWSASMVSAAE